MSKDEKIDQLIAEARAAGCKCHPEGEIVGCPAGDKCIHSWTFKQKVQASK